MQENLFLNNCNGQIVLVKALKYCVAYNLVEMECSLNGQLSDQGRMVYFAHSLNSCSFQDFFFCFVTSTGVLLTFVCNDRMSDTVDEMDSTSRGLLNEAISFINRTVGVSCNLIKTCRGYGDPMVMALNC